MCNYYLLKDPELIKHYKFAATKHHRNGPSLEQRNIQIQPAKHMRRYFFQEYSNFPWTLLSSSRKDCSNLLEQHDVGTSLLDKRVLLWASLRKEWLAAPVPNEGDHY